MNACGIVRHGVGGANNWDITSARPRLHAGKARTVAGLHAVGCGHCMLGERPILLVCPPRATCASAVLVSVRDWCMPCICPRMSRIACPMLVCVHVPSHAASFAVGSVCDRWRVITTARILPTRCACRRACCHQRVCSLVPSRHYASNCNPWQLDGQLLVLEFRVVVVAFGTGCP